MVETKTELVERKEVSKVKEYSSLPKKQRKRLYNLAAHKKVRVFSSHLSKELKKEYGKRALPLRTGDKIKVMTGNNAGKMGKIVRFDKPKHQVFVEGIVRKKSDGQEALVPLHPSNLLITEVVKDDLKRFKGSKVVKEEKKNR